MNVAVKLERQDAEKTIRELARTHGVTAERLPIDDWADDISRLSDAEVESDEVEDLLVNLERAGVIDGATGLDLYAEYLRQMCA
ncbi:MAG: hypothetical protein FWD68_09810 [Alphaproteobacteria bacterium]|nr:hypothetical protein [Alphaproteobacteria bacterium]